MSESQGSEGFGFVIPSNLLKAVAETPIKEGKVTCGDLGIVTQDLSNSIRRGLKMPSDTHGVVVTEAIPFGPGTEAAVAAEEFPSPKPHTSNGRLRRPRQKRDSCSGSSGAGLPSR